MWPYSERRRWRLCAGCLWLWCEWPSWTFDAVIVWYLVGAGEPAFGIHTAPVCGCAFDLRIIGTLAVAEQNTPKSCSETNFGVSDNRKPRLQTDLADVDGVVSPHCRYAALIHNIHDSQLSIFWTLFLKKKKVTSTANGDKRNQDPMRIESETPPPPTSPRLSTPSHPISSSSELSAKHVHKPPSPPNLPSTT